MTSKNRSRSSIFKLNQDTPEIHPWHRFGHNEFGLNATNICWVIMFTSEKCKFSCWNWLPWPHKICHGKELILNSLQALWSRSSIFKRHQNTPRIHPWYKFGSNATNIVELPCLQAIDIIYLKDRSRSSIFKLKQDTPEIHPWHKFWPNATNICWVIVFTNEYFKFSSLNQPHDLEK